MDQDTRQQAIYLYDRFTHDGMERRAFMAEVVKLAGSVAAAELLVAGIAASPASAAIVPADDKRLRATDVYVRLPGMHAYRAYIAMPRKAAARASVMVVHENRGLNFHIRDIARRVALAGYTALAPDLLSPVGGTRGTEDEAREAIGRLDLAAATHDVVRLLGFLRGRRTSTGKVGAVGFCWGGGMIDRLAVEADGMLNAAVSYYGPAPAASEAPKVQAPLLMHLAGLDDRVNSTALPFANALKAAGKTVQTYVYPGVNHAFNNDTAADRYSQPAADLAWKRTLDFFDKYLS